MDYDDSEFQNQSFQLVGEENNKFPSSLQSFALPKIDIDEHLQVHLRFDSLVDTDILLGIQGQDNNWIEDFSSGTTAIEFSSTAAESCSISRHNNVWSEATSSESVEMLLKSVVEDEMTDRNMEAVAHDGLIGEKGKTDSTLKQDDDHSSKMGDTGQNDPSLPPDKCMSDLTMVDEVTIGVQTPVEGSAVQKSSDCITCTSAQDNPSSALGNLSVGPEEFHIPVPSDQVVEEDTRISMAERSDFLSDDGLKETSHVTKRDEVNVQYLRGQEVMRHLCSGKDCSCLDPIMDSMVPMDQECNKSGFSENPDGFLEAIAYPMKALNKDTEASERSSIRAKDMCSQVTEGDTSIGPQTLKVGNEHDPVLSHLGEDSEDVCCKQSDPCSKVEYLRAELPTHTAKNHEEELLDSYIEVTGGEESPERHLTKNSSIGDASKMALEVHATAPVDFETQINEVKDVNGLDNFKSQTPEPAVVEKHFEDEAAKKPEAGVNVSDSHMPAVLSDVDVKITSPIALEVHATAPMDFETQINEVKDVNGLDNFKSQTPEPAVVVKHFEDEAAKKPEAGVNVSDAHMPAALSDVDVKITSPIADDLDGRDKLVPSTCPEVTSGNNDGGVLTEKSEDRSSSGKNADTTSVLTDTVAKMTKDESVIGHAKVDVELVPLKKDTNIQQSLPDISKHVDEVVEQKGKSIDAQLPNEPVAITDPVVTSSSHPKGELHNESGTKVASLDHQDISAVEQNEEANSSSLASELIQSHEKEIIYSANAYLSHPEGNLLTQLSSRPVAKPTNDDHSPLDSTTESQTIIDRQSSSYVDSVDPSCQNEPQSLINKSISQENTVGIKGVLVVNDSASNVNDASVSPAFFTPVDKEIAVNVTVRLASNDEGQTLLETPSSEKNSSGDAQNYFTKISAFSSSRSDGEDHLVEANSGKPSTLEPNCGSPTVISCSEHVEDEEGSRVLLDQTGIASNNAPQISSETGGNREKVLSKAEDDRSFTFEVGSLADISKKNPGIEWKPFPSMQTSELPKISKEKSHGSHTESKVGKQHGVRRKTANADKTTRVTVSSNESLTTPKKKSAKGTSIVKTPGDKDARSCSVTSTSVGTVSRDMQLEESRQCKGNEMKTSCSPIVQTSGLPDLNSSVAATTLFYQPFTDLQQVQLRAQIFVYGSLIQGVPPDEACMVSAFGGTDRGRSSWEAVWRLSLEKYQNQKSPLVNSETKHPRSAVRVPEQVSRCSSLQSKVSNTSASQSGGKVVPSALQNSTPLPSPVWSTSTNDVLIPNMPRGMHLDFNQASSPLQSYYSSQTRQFANNSTPWSSQAPRNGPRGVPIQGSTLNAVTQYSTVPVVETVKVTPVRDSSMTRAPNIQLVTPGSLLPTSSPLSATAVTVVKNETQRKTASPGTNKNASINQKPRKRKKAAGADDLSSTIPVSQSTTEPGSTGIVEIVPPASADLVSSSRMPTKVASGIITTTPNIFPASIVSNNTTEQRAIFSEETSSRIEQAKLQAEDAASLAAVSVRHSQGIWSQLAAQRDSGLASEVEVKLASAAVAAAAAASVAKAAAAAAKVASDAALQAKMMADESLGLATKENLTQIPESGSDTGKSLGRLTPDSVLKGKEKIDGSSSVISAAREAARRRVEAASAAAKQAENIDAIVKAAELAAEAVSQAGAIIAMGDPLPFRLSELIDAGPEAFRKLLQTGTEKVNTNNLLGEEDMGLNHSDHHDRVVKQSNEKPLNNKGIRKTGTEYSVSNSEQSGTLAGNYQGELVNSLTVQNDRHQRDQLSTSLMESDIQQGSLVEVVSDDDGLRGAWFSAHVLDLKDNKAYVCYDNLLTDKGSEQLKEWVSLDGEGNTAPRIRIAHPMTTSKHEGTRKRRREAVGNYVWAIGDHVDAWMRDGWWEGVVTEKIQGDETKLTVYFPAGGDSSVVRAWSLRPSLVWKDGQWTEWLRARENTLCPYEGDTPKEKRPKLGRSEANFDAEFDGRGIGKLSKNIPLEDPGNPEESRPLNLSAKDRVFSVGRNVREERISEALKVKRTGLQKEGSRVVFGVPKPGKKRKFMEVSKHYVTDNKIDKTSEGNDSLKFAKYLMPQQSRLWKNTSKVEPKGKQAGEFNKTRGIKSLKSQTIQTRSTSEKDTSSLSATSVSNRGDGSRGALHNLRAGISEKTTLEKNPVEVVSFPSSLGTSASLSLDSHMQALPGLPAAKKKSTSAAEGDSGAKGRSTSSMVKPTRSEDKGEKSVKEMSDSIEPRRSNRKIQPTSRLLEGLQSSLVISKIPSFSHDRGARSKHRGSSSSRGSSRG
ncbi:uncharacterized protein M6B38_258700 [Iris pallida]|uniref:Agenet domain-containing protein n=1 Tax=Iris pallida TaxID=29817 RepID=A0AAX6IG86_IRIPA|nr:uncharacterized protein M6B38_258700 [Iris pallida]